LKLFDVLKAAPLARLGYHQYTAIDNVFEMKVPLMPDDFVSGRVLSGASGNQKPEKVTAGDEDSEIKN
jgi:hypothetical protein